MITVRKANDRGHADHGWLDTNHTFSFASYHDPQHMGFRSLRVMNEDRVAPGKGFGTHGHDNMEIISYVLSGALEHKDSMGNGEVLRPGEFQRISAGSGITHSEFNPSSEEPVHFYQIWLVPNVRDIEPSYQQREFDEDEKLNRLRMVASPDGDDGSLSIHTDAKVYLSKLEAGNQVGFDLEPSRHGWLQVLSGSVAVSGHQLSTSDGAAITNEDSLSIVASEDAEIMLFDLA
ncbi:pirin family protein [Crateriforma spongiae]|uniref:pirin family protein n=1 Tax=Crateriforma spongiae TaxID=2724528 RepID=UPI0014451CEC|nr:pirin family protein [Crateriforma spongiae]